MLTTQTFTYIILLKRLFYLTCTFIITKKYVAAVADDADKFLFKKGT
jgi:hypothetical protein